MTTILGVKINNRKENALEVQKVLTEYGCNIRTRLGLNMVNNSEECSDTGLLILELLDNDEAINISEILTKINNIEVQSMIF